VSHATLLAAPGLLLLLVPLACSGEPARAAEPRFAGRVVLRGELARADAGMVRVDAWADPADVLPVLSRRYALDDPAFAREGAELVLSFELDARHAVERAGGEPGAPTAVEACFETSGLLQVALGGDVTARTAVAPGAMDIDLVLASRAVLYDGEFPGD
jgi:hypothetical protein